jgi:hypothetical protein
MRDDTHGYTKGFPAWCKPRGPFEVFERVRFGKRSDTYTGSLRYAIDRRNELVRQGRPAYVIDVDGRRVEVLR